MITIGANIGTEIENLIGTVNNEDTRPAFKSGLKRVLVGLELPPDVPGTITSDACRNREGRVIIGPPVGMGLSYEQFVERLHVRKLIMHRFVVNRRDPKARIMRGSFVGLKPGYYTCKCNHGKVTKQTGPAVFKKEVKCACGARMKFNPESPAVNPEDKGIQSLYEMYKTAPNKSVSPFPRVWGLYKADKSPSDIHAGSESDKLAAELAKRADAYGMVACNWDIASKSGSAPDSLVVETLPGLRVGILTESELTGDASIGDDVTKKLVLRRAGKHKVQKRNNRKVRSL